MHWHAYDEDEGKRRILGRIWSHGRAWLHLRDPETGVARGPIGCLGVEWTLFRRSPLGIGFGVGGDERLFRIHLGLLWWSFWLWAEPGRYRYRESREFDLSWHGGGFWLNPWIVRHEGGCKADPWWRRTHHWDVGRMIFGRPRYRMVEGPPRSVLIPMPEGCYAAHAHEYRQEWRYRFGIVRRQVGWDFEIDSPAGIPFQGKGENSWDCGPDGTRSIAIRGEPCLEEAIGRVVGDMLKLRARRGNTAAVEAAGVAMARVGSD